MWRRVRLTICWAAIILSLTEQFFLNTGSIRLEQHIYSLSAGVYSYYFSNVSPRPRAAKPVCSVFSHSVIGRKVFGQTRPPSSYESKSTSQLPCCPKAVEQSTFISTSSDRIRKLAYQSAVKNGSGIQICSVPG